MRTRAIFGSGAQSASLIAIGSFAVHQLCYFPAGHLLPMALGFALAVLSAQLVRCLLGGRGPGTERRFKATTYALGIAAVFCCQELLEGVLVAGHASGLAAIFSAGGWAALPLAALFGVLAALIDRGIEAIESRLAQIPALFDHVPLRASLASTPARFGRRLSPLALGLARRPPPALA